MQGEAGQLQQQLDQRDRDVALLEADIVQALRDVRDAARGETEALRAAESEREVCRFTSSLCRQLWLRLIPSAVASMVVPKCRA